MPGYVSRAPGRRLVRRPGKTDRQGKSRPSSFSLRTGPSAIAGGQRKEPMVKETLPNQGRQSVKKFSRCIVSSLRRALMNPKTPALLIRWVHFAVAIVRLFDRR
jgi:hypothetical protein